MKAIRIHEFGGPEVLKYEDVPDPVLRKDQVLVRVRACALNHLDLWVRQGLPSVKLPRIPGEAHEMNWVNAAKGKTEASCPFEYAARLTEVMLLGVVALRAGKKISYDGANMRVTNLPQANDYLRREYRQGWSV